MNRIITATIRRIERKGISKDGNPHYELHLTDGTSLPTMPDAQIGYLIVNPEYQGVPIELAINAQGQVITASVPAPPRPPVPPRSSRH